MTKLLDFATTIAFLFTPVFAFVNYKVITNTEIISKEHQPGKPLLYLGRFGIVFLTSVSVAYLSWHLWTK